MTYGADWNWFDLVVLVLLFLGFWRGRKHGMSTELLPLLKLIVVIVVGVLIYKPFGDWFDAITGNNLERWICYVIAYFVCFVVIHTIFTWIKKAVGEKLVSGDLFGSMEYYLGMLAGILRYAGYVILFLALARAREIDYQQEAAYQKTQLQELGSNYFPSFYTIQIQIFDKSMVGQFAKNHLSKWLIEPTAVENVSEHKETIGSRRGRDIEDASQGRTK